ncbi:hypothetical protein ABZ907_15495 [Nonomuraea wenchangensis]
MSAFGESAAQGQEFRKAKVGGEVDRRSVVNPGQAWELLTAVTYAGRSRGPMLRALFACMYFGGLRPGEAAGLRQDDCLLPKKGWGLLTLQKTRSESMKRYTDSGERHDERGLKHRDVKTTRIVPVPAAEQRARHGVDVLLKVYAKCTDGQREVANGRILEALSQ